MLENFVFDSASGLGVLWVYWERNIIEDIMDDVFFLVVFLVV
jgi:hypothetical protein